jgi:hypothetical protein
VQLALPNCTHLGTHVPKRSSLPNQHVMFNQHASNVPLAHPVISIIISSTAQPLQPMDKDMDSSHQRARVNHRMLPRLTTNLRLLRSHSTGVEMINKLNADKNKRAHLLFQSKFLPLMVIMKPSNKSQTPKLLMLENQANPPLASEERVNSISTKFQGRTSQIHSVEEKSATANASLLHSVLIVANTAELSHLLLSLITTNTLLQTYHNLQSFHLHFHYLLLLLCFSTRILILFFNKPNMKYNSIALMIIKLK